MPAVHHFANHQYGVSFNELTKTNETLYMDLWAPPPDEDTRPQRPTVVLIHGGSFVGGDKSNFESLASSFCHDQEAHFTFTSHFTLHIHFTLHLCCAPRLTL